MKKLSILIIVLLAFVNCEQDESNEMSQVMIRIKNSSAYDFKNIIVDTNGGTNNYGDLDSNEISDYKSFNFAYNIAFVELEIDGEKYTIQPIDYIGDSKLDKGNYSYMLNAWESGDQYGRLYMVVEKD